MAGRPEVPTGMRSELRAVGSENRPTVAAHPSMVLAHRCELYFAKQRLFGSLGKFRRIRATNCDFQRW